MKSPDKFINIIRANKLKFLLNYNPFYYYLWTQVINRLNENLELINS